MTHAVVGAAIAYLMAPRFRSALAIAATCAMLPDIDVLGLRLGIPYGDMLGHRGLTHSLAFAAGAFVIANIFWKARFAACAGIAMASHGILDAFTNGGRGVAFFAPFSAERYFFPVTPIAVSPIGLGFFSSRGASVLLNEFLWVWCPVIIISAAVHYVRFRNPER